MLRPFSVLVCTFVVVGLDSRHLAAQGVDHKFTLATELKIHDRSTATAVFSPDGELIATSSIDRSVRITDWRKGKVEAILEGFSTGDEGTWDRDVLFLKDGKRLITANSAASVELWDWRANKRLWKQDFGARSLSLSPDETQLLCADWEHPDIRLLDVATGKVHETLSGIGVPLSAGCWSQGSVAYSPKGKLFASALGGTRDDSAPEVVLNLWHAGIEKPVFTLNPGSNRLHALVWSPAGDQLVGAGTEGKIVRLQLPKLAPGPKGAKEIAKLIKDLDADDFQTRQDAQRELQGVAPVIEKELAAALEKEESAEARWRLKEILKAARTLVPGVDFLPKEHAGTIMGLAFSPRGSLLASVSRVHKKNEGRLVVWDLARLDRPLFTWEGPGLTSVNFSRDGKHLTVSTQDGRARVWIVEPVKD